MRSRQEITFRLRQEAANAILAFSSPNLSFSAESPLARLPEPNAVANKLRGSEYAVELVRTADEILRGRIPIFDSFIDYGARIAWRRDPREGIETPPNYFRRVPYLDAAAAGDHKFVWEINRHQHLVLLAQATLLTGNHSYSDHLFRQVEHWWTENPFQRGINWTSALEVAFRALSWIWVFHLIGHRMASDFRGRFLAELYRHGLHLEYNLSIYFSPNTHLLGEAVALHALGRLFPVFPRAKHWRTLGGGIVHTHMETCVRNDGSYFEQSTYYHMYALDMFAFHAVLEDAPAPYLEKLGRMAEFLAAIVSNSGDLPFVGDDDGGRFYHPYGPRPRFGRGSLATASAMLGQRYFSYTDSDLAEIAMWWLGPERCAVEPPAVPDCETCLFKDTGVVVIRQGPVTAVFDTGPFGPGSAGHSHSDTLSLVASLGQDEVLIDSGTFSYMDPDWRPRFRGSSAHNTIRIDAGDQGVPAGPFRWSQKPEVRLLEFETSADRDGAAAQCSYSGFQHTRTISRVNSELLVEDRIEGPDGQHDIEQFWHVAHEPRGIAPGIWAIGDFAELHAEGGIVEQSWRSRCFGSKEPAWKIAVRLKTALPLALRARLRWKE